MKEEKNILNDSVERGISDRDLSLSEIPDLDLYIDQILTLVATKNQTAAQRYKDNILTKTMINNYSKEGLLTPVKGKKYTKEQIVQMLLIYSMKSSLSIGDIHRVLDGARSEGVTGERLMQSYDRHLADKGQIRSLVASSVKKINREGQLESEDGSDFLVALLDLLSYSAYLRGVALELLEARYPAVEDEKEKEKEKKEKAEKDKKEKDKTQKSASEGDSEI